MVWKLRVRSLRSGAKPTQQLSACSSDATMQSVRASADSLTSDRVDWPKKVQTCWLPHKRSSKKFKKSGTQEVRTCLRFGQGQFQALAHSYLPSGWQSSPDRRVRALVHMLTSDPVDWPEVQTLCSPRKYMVRPSLAEWMAQKKSELYVCH